jgi:predicted nucleic acid-binding protein
MPDLLDTNILLRIRHRQAAEYQSVRSALRVLVDRGEEPYFTSQNLVEFWNVCTRPSTARRGFGLAVAETDKRARLLERIPNFLPDTAAIHMEWRQIVVAQGITGVQVHDARLVAAMKVHGLTQVLTLNTADFARYPGITAVHPQSIR